MGATPTPLPAPIGSAEYTINPTYGPETLGSANLDSLAHNAESSSMAYANPSGKTYATVSIFLNPISPTGTPKIQLVGSSDIYEITISTTASIARKIDFIDMPASFLASFKLKNLTNVALASSQNYVVVTPQY